MINARLYKDNKGAYRLTIKGHSGMAPKGADLICACATTAAYQLAQVAKEMEAGGKLSKPPAIAIREGKAKIALTPNEEHVPETEHTLYVVCTALRLLAANYPKSIVYVDDLG